MKKEEKRILKLLPNLYTQYFIFHLEKKDVVLLEQTAKTLKSEIVELNKLFPLLYNEELSLFRTPTGCGKTDTVIRALRKEISLKQKELNKISKRLSDYYHSKNQEDRISISKRK